MAAVRQVRRLRRSMYCQGCGTTVHRVIEFLEADRYGRQVYRWRCTRCGAVMEAP